MNSRSRSDQSRYDRILDAAMEVFSQQSASEATLQMIADSAGVSVGLVQHHFGSKDGLIGAVDAHAMTVIGAAMTQSLPESPTDAVLEMGRRVGSLLSDHRAVVDYLARLLVDGTESGIAFFDATVTIVLSHWRQLAESGVTREDLDLVWAALNPTILVFGAIILRRHIDRHLPEPLWTPEQLRRWEESVNTLLRYGEFRN
ncbi:TetR family transcriptional regulator [Mycolicibacterium helvum]|uniref:TetR family transcriptional regulator n=2 Tax=Mycolicibacterium helvum TaxID=1534349 RepID=A0A7I7T641_9MYCO|nr:TetR family transcriptional regulator [Mycolicibacterium helvum]